MFPYIWREIFCTQLSAQHARSPPFPHCPLSKEVTSTRHALHIVPLYYGGFLGFCTSNSDPSTLPYLTQKRKKNTYTRLQELIVVKQLSALYPSLLFLGMVCMPLTPGEMGHHQFFGTGSNTQNSKQRIHQQRQVFNLQNTHPEVKTNKETTTWVPFPLNTHP